LQECRKIGIDRQRFDRRQRVAGAGTALLPQPGPRRRRRRRRGSRRSATAAAFADGMSF
jgi:hypothetical protein